jgi:hypothetical protein
VQGFQQHQSVAIVETPLAIYLFLSDSGLALKSLAARRTGSIPVPGTNSIQANGQQDSHWYGLQPISLGTLMAHAFSATWITR